MFQPLTLRLMAAAEDAAANPDAPQRECYRQAEIQIKVRRGGNCRARQGILHHKVCERRAAGCAVDVRCQRAFRLVQLGYPRG
jgi:hypothetical protein